VISRPTNSDSTLHSKFWLLIPECRGLVDQVGAVDFHGGQSRQELDALQFSGARTRILVSLVEHSVRAVHELGG